MLVNMTAVALFFCRTDRKLAVEVQICRLEASDWPEGF